MNVFIMTTYYSHQKIRNTLQSAEQEIHYILHYQIYVFLEVSTTTSQARPIMRYYLLVFEVYSDDGNLRWNRIWMKYFLAKNMGLPIKKLHGRWNSTFFFHLLLPSTSHMLGLSWMSTCLFWIYIATRPAHVFPLLHRSFVFSFVIPYNF